MIKGRRQNNAVPKIKLNYKLNSQQIISSSLHKSPQRTFVSNGVLLIMKRNRLVVGKWGLEVGIVSRGRTKLPSQS